MLTGIAGEIAKMKAEIKLLEKKGVDEVKRAANIIVRKLQARTPVWTGETVRNYTAGVGGKNSSHTAGSDEPPPGSTPRGLGNEENRGVNERGAIAAINSLLGSLNNLKRNIHITNTIGSAKWDLIDNGSAPTKARARNPGGVSGLAIAGARALLRNWT